MTTNGIEQLRNYIKNTEQFNVFRIFKMENYEIRHSNFLAWLLNPAETHDFGNCFLKEFIHVILAIGNGANKVLNKFSQKHTANLNLVNINTDKEILDTLKTPEIKNVLLMLDEKFPDTHLGCGGDPFIAESLMRNIESNKNLIKDELKKSENIIILSCLGGGLGSAVAPIISTYASVTKKNVISIITLPFKFEGKSRNNLANYEIYRIKSFSNKCIVLENETFADEIPENSHNAFEIIDEKLIDIISETITQI